MMINNLIIHLYCLLAAKCGLKLVFRKIQVKQSLYYIQHQHAQQLLYVIKKWTCYIRYYNYYELVY